jgi:hypothetical protein
MKEYHNVGRRISEEIERVMRTPREAVIPISEAAGKGALTNVIELADPVFFSEDHEISINGIVYLLTVKQLVKTLQNKWGTSRSNRFPEMVKEVIETGDSAKLAMLARFKTDDMVSELRRAHAIIPDINANAIVVLAKLDPIIPVGEWMEDGMHTSGRALEAIRFPFVIEANGASFKFASETGVKISDGRTEKTMIIDLHRFSAIATGTEDNIVELRKGIAIPYVDDLAAVIGILLFVAGILLIFATRLRLAEIGVIPAIAGALLLLFRYVFGVDYFSNRIIDVKGDAPIIIDLYGELK